MVPLVVAVVDGLVVRAHSSRFLVCLAVTVATGALSLISPARKKLAFMGCVGCWCQVVISRNAQFS